MSTRVSRRRIVAGGAWALPTVIVAGAAPAVAASTTCAVQLTGYTVVSTSQYVNLTLTVTGAPFGTAASATVVSAPANFNPSPINPTVVGPNGIVPFAITRSALGPVGAGDFVVSISVSARPKACVFTIQFPYQPR